MNIGDSDIFTSEDKALFRKAWEITRERMGKDFTFYLPGMIKYGRERGRYPALSITGDSCDLLCEHCKGLLLGPMIKAPDPEILIEKGKRLAKAGALGLLLSGGSDRLGKLPWERFIEAIKTLSEENHLYLSAHVGFPDSTTSAALKQAGITQALMDVMGDDETAQGVYHLKGLAQVLESLGGIAESGLQFVPHIVAGLFYGKIRAEYKALELICQYRPSSLVIVVLTPLQGAPMAHVVPPSPLQIARLIAYARLLMPDIPISLGCERPRNRNGLSMERWAIRAGATRMAVWSEEAVEEAKTLGLNPRFQPTCCSVEFRRDFSTLGPYVPR